MGDVTEVDLGSGGGGGAPTDNTYIVKDLTGSAGLTAQVALSALSASAGLLHVADDGTPSIDTSAYLTTGAAAGIYETSAHAAATYLTTAAAAGTYLASATAATTYAPIGAKYLCQTANGALTNEQDLSALSTGFMRVASGTGVVTSDTSTYLTTASAASTYLTQASAAATYLDIATAGATYWPIPSLTSTNVLYATGAATVGQDASFTWTAGTSTLNAALITTGSVTAPTGNLGVNSTSGDVQVQGSAVRITVGANYRLNGLTSNGFVKTTGGNGVLAVDTTTYLSTTTAASTYETQTHAASTYLTIATAASTYQAALSLSTGRVVYAASSSTTTSIASFKFTAASGFVADTVSVPTLEISEADASNYAIKLTSANPQSITQTQSALEISAASVNQFVAINTQSGRWQLDSTGRMNLNSGGFIANGTQIVALGAFGPASLTSLVPSVWGVLLNSTTAKKYAFPLYEYT